MMDVEHISDLDLERHARMLAGVREAQRLQQRAADLQGAFRIWAEELHERYGLASDGTEGIGEDGQIVRVPTIDASSPEFHEHDFADPNWTPGKD